MFCQCKYKFLFGVMVPHYLAVHPV
jgi:hypothetical protein